MLVKKEQIPILIANMVMLAGFSTLFLYRENYEFMLYVGIIVFFLLLIIFTNNRVNYPNTVLWGLTAWAGLHMSGGGIYLQGRKLYELMLIDIVGEPYNIFKYDQFVHMVGFGVATLVMFYVLQPSLKDNLSSYKGIGVVVVMAGLGVGGLNEIVEFLATVLVPDTGGGDTKTRRSTLWPT